MMPVDEGVVVVSLVTAGIAAFFFWKWRNVCTVIALVEQTPTSAIDRISGFVEVSGRISERSELLESPLTQTACAYYCLEVEERVTSTGKRDRAS